MSTPTRRAAGAFPVRPVTGTAEVTAAPLSGMATSAVFSNVVPGGGVAPVPRVQIAWARASLLRSRAVSLMFAVVSQDEW
ncbi:hypothetical protein SGLAM104S_05886 [Streptomyces glaucescens]